MKVIRAEKIGADPTLFFGTNTPNDDDRPATKRDLNELGTGLRAEFRTDIEQLRTDLHADMHQLRDELIDKMREMQTEVLRAFYDWARPVETRLNKFDELNSRLGLLEGRVTEIEKRNLGL